MTPVLEARVYTSAYDKCQHYISAVKPHLKFYAGRWHCRMANTMEWQDVALGSAWRNWFEFNGRSGHPDCSDAVFSYMHRYPRYSGMTLRDILAVKGLQA